MTAKVQPKTVPFHFLGPPGAFNPTLLLFFGGLTLLLGSTYAHYKLALPGWCSFVANTLALHFAGTVIHDACHKVAHHNRIVNAALGHGSALMLGFAFPFLREFTCSTMQRSTILIMIPIIMCPQEDRYG